MNILIDDWVSYGGTPIKVENVYKDCINFQHDIPFVQEEFLIEQTEIEPIPLTPEILEKNGLVNKNDEWVHYCDFPFIDFTLNKDSDGFYIDCMLDGYIKYVHELQHAFKLFKVDGEIII